MFSNQSAEVSLNAPCRAVASVLADRVESRFLVGASSVVAQHHSNYNNNYNNNDGGGNQLHILRYHSDVNVLGIDASLDHPTGAIQHVCTSPTDRTLVLTVPAASSNQTNSSSATTSAKATLYKIPPSIMEMNNEWNTHSSTADSETNGRDEYLYNDSSIASSLAENGVGNASTRSSSSSSNNRGRDTLEAKATLETDDNANILDAKWRSTPEEDVVGAAAMHGNVVTLNDRGTITQWDLSLGMAESTRTLATNTTAAADLTVPVMARPRVTFDPHQATNVTVSWDTSIRCFDLRSHDTDSALAGTIPRAHRYGVTAMDYNPNKPYTMVTSGLDGLIRYWDMRTTKRPIMTTRGGHSHYAWSVQYNPFHDQLVLSTGTDAIVNLWRMSTISSAPLLPSDDYASQTSAPNVRVARHEASDSVYGAAWGAADAWLYLYVAYDGKVSLQHVCSKEKYKILL